MDPNSMSYAGANAAPDPNANAAPVDNGSMNMAGATPEANINNNVNANLGGVATDALDLDSMAMAGATPEAGANAAPAPTTNPDSMSMAGAEGGAQTGETENRRSRRELSPAAKAAILVGGATLVFSILAGIHAHNKNKAAEDAAADVLPENPVEAEATAEVDQLRTMDIETVIRDGDERTEYKSGDIEINLDGEALKNYNDINNKKNVNSLSTFSYDKATAKDKSDTELAKEFIENSVEKIAKGEDMLSAVEVVAQNGYNPESEGFKIDGIEGKVDSKNEMTTLINEANSNKDLRDALTNKALETLDNEYDEYETGVLRYEGNYISSCATEIDGNKLAYHGGVDAATQGSEITIEQKFDEDGNNIYDINEVNSKKYNLLKNYNIIPNDASDEDALKIMSEYTVLGKSHDCEQMVVVRIDGDYATIMHIAVPEVPGGPEGTPDTAGNEGDGGSVGEESDYRSAGIELDGKTANTHAGPNVDKQPTTPGPEAGVAIDTMANTGAPNKVAPGSSSEIADESFYQDQQGNGDTDTQYDGDNSQWDTPVEQEESAPQIEEPAPDNDSEAAEESAAPNTPEVSNEEAGNIFDDMKNGA